MAAESKKPQLEIRDFKRTAVSINVTPAGNRLLIQGFDEPGEKVEHRTTKVFELPSGRAIWTSARTKTTSSSNGVGPLDATGHIVAMVDEAPPRRAGIVLTDLESGRRVRASNSSFEGLGPNVSINVIVGDAPGSAAKPVRTVVQGDSDEELVRIGLMKHSSKRVAISNDSQYVVFGCSDGSVTVTDLPRLQRELVKVGLGW